MAAINIGNSRAISRTLLRGGYSQILTAGGAYSNRIYATVEIYAALNLPCVGLIRGELRPALNPTLAFAQQKGMKLRYVDRAVYKQIRKDDLRAISKFALL